MEEYFQLFDDRAKGAVSDEEVVNRFGRTVLELFQMRRLLISYDADTMEMLHPQGVNPGSELEEMRVRWDEVPESSSVTTRGEAAVSPERMAVGASTSALGLLGAFLAKYNLGESTSAQSQAIAHSTPLILLMVNVAPEADVVGHIAGFASGYLLYWALHKEGAPSGIQPRASGV
eukprot:s8448_g3.t1